MGFGQVRIGALWEILGRLISVQAKCLQNIFMRVRMQGNDCLKEFKSSMNSTRESRFPENSGDGSLELVGHRHIGSSKKVESLQKPLKPIMRNPLTPNSVNRYSKRTQTLVAPVISSRFRNKEVETVERDLPELGIVSRRQSDIFKAEFPGEGSPKKRSMFKFSCKTPAMRDLNQHLKLVDKSQIIFKIDQEKQTQKAQFIVFWVTESRKVRLIQNETTEIPQCADRSMIEIYGRIKIKFFNYIITEDYKSNSLDKFIEQFGPCTERLLKKNIPQLLLGLKKLHRNGNVFNVLSLEKIFRRTDGSFALDLVMYEPNPQGEDKKNLTYYVSPELLLNNRVHEKNDVWSIGCVILSLVLGVQLDPQISIHPYNQREIWGQDVWKKINFYRRNHKPLVVSSKAPIQLEISEQLYDLILSCLQTDQSSRPDIDRLLAHPFFK